jgi:hypothetical protein
MAGFQPNERTKQQISYDAAWNIQFPHSVYIVKQFK